MEIPTHNSNKYVSENKWTNEDPKNDVKSAKHIVRDFSDILIDYKPVIKSKQLEKCNQGIDDWTEIN